LLMFGILRLHALLSARRYTKRHTESGGKLGWRDWGVCVTFAHRVNLTFDNAPAPLNPLLLQQLRSGLGSNPVGGAAGFFFLIYNAPHQQEMHDLHGSLACPIVTTN
jgi:hypothetical protein